MVVHIRYNFGVQGTKGYQSKTTLKYKNVNYEVQLYTVIAPHPDAPNVNVTATSDTTPMMTHNYGINSNLLSI